MMGPDVLLVSVMAANSETGVLNAVAEIAEQVHAYGAFFHCDVTQLVGRMGFDLDMVGADLVSLSGHKICGPGGVGALVGTRRGLRGLRPLIHGGGHERGLRSGSINVGGVVGLGAAARLASEERNVEAARVSRLRDRLVSEIRQHIPDVHENGDLTRRLPNTASIRFVGADADAVMVNMEPVAVSTGSACSSGSVEPSGVLLAMGLGRDAAFESIRFSLGRFTTPEDIDMAVLRTVTAVSVCSEDDPGRIYRCGSLTRLCRCLPVMRRSILAMDGSARRTLLRRGTQACSPAVMPLWLLVSVRTWCGLSVSGDWPRSC